MGTSLCTPRKGLYTCPYGAFFESAIEHHRLLESRYKGDSDLCMPCCPCFPGGADRGVGYSNTRDTAVGDRNIPRERRCNFGIFFPEDVSARPVHMFFDREKAASKVLEGAVAHAGLKLERGRLVGSPDRLNLFTIDGDVLRLDLELEAHLGSTLHPSSVLILEKGNRISDERIASVKVAAAESSGGGCVLM